MTVVGEIEIGENVVFQGPVRGNITVTGDHQVILARSSSVHGTVRGKAVVISCQVEGDIEAERLILMEGAAVRGDIRYGTLAMAEGARIDGRLTAVIPNVIAEQPAEPDPVKELGIDLGANARVELNREEDGAGAESTNVSELRPASAVRSA
jgi:cytoskeletal protein CcmA (bactofilin family)